MQGLNLVSTNSGRFRFTGKIGARIHNNLHYKTIFKVSIEEQIQTQNFAAVSVHAQTHKNIPH